MKYRSDALTMREAKLAGIIGKLKRSIFFAIETEKLLPTLFRYMGKNTTQKMPAVIRLLVKRPSTPHSRSTIKYMLSDNATISLAAETMT